MIHLCVLCFRICSSYASYSLREIFCEKFFGRNFFYCLKIISSKQVCNKNIEKIFWLKIFYCCKIPIASIYSSYSSQYIPLRRFILPCMIYIGELFFPIWPSYGSSSSQSFLYICSLFFHIWSTHAWYASVYDLLMQVILWGKFFVKFFGRKFFIV